MRKTKLLAALAAGVVALVSQAALAEGDAANGEKIFKKCKTCHEVSGDKKKPGPTLEGLFGRTSGTVEGFKYSSAMQEAAIVWDEATLDEFLTKPKDMVPKTKMAFAGLKKEQDRADLIAYLMEATKTE